ncbi:M61 family metallopeptidase [Candidatus Kinetoplastidibacterium galati]|uniref:M61 family peptidase n=1 Tax=Candidatus Kinetoplastidibacterium galati TCC219 TaxID=1208921 RepID=M1L882_9PROT|nr:PDZ domain-containing protein [Candidatus Kinetoplastibacterium galatii]AGF48773.1 M61 family peptidase [Candidatus Kinetoplastibacterium galatii TCC219]
MEKSINYQLEIFDIPGHRYKVQIKINKPNQNGQILSMPSWIPGSYTIRDFSRNIETIYARSNGSNINIKKINDHSWKIDKSDNPVTVEYVIYAFDKSVRGSYIDDERAFFNGSSMFLRIDGQQDLNCLLQIKKINNWNIYTSLPTLEAAYINEDKQFWFYYSKCYDELIDHPIEIGNPKTSIFFSGGTMHEIILSGDSFRIDINRINQDAKKICDSQVEFFDPIDKISPFSDSSDRFIFFININSNCHGGLEHRTSSALCIGKECLPMIGEKETPEKYIELLELLSHEYFHAWLIKRIKPEIFIDYKLQESNQTSLLWVFEGFTSYYEDIFLLRTGLINRNTYANIICKKINILINSPGRKKQTLAQSSFDAWTRYYKQDENSPNSIVSYYIKGSIVALGLDSIIRKQSNERYSLDDVIKFMWYKYGCNFYKGIKRGISEDNLVEIIKKSTNINTGIFIENYIYGLVELPIQDWLMQFKIKLELIDTEKPTLHAKTSSKNNGILLETILENGIAHKSGLSSGDLLIAIDGIMVDNRNNGASMLNGYRIGDHANICVFRNNKLKFFNIHLDESEKIYEVKLI